MVHKSKTSILKGTLVYIEIKMTGEENTQRKRKNAQANNITTTKVDVLPNSCTPSSYANFTLDV